MDSSLSVNPVKVPTSTSGVLSAAGAPGGQLTTRAKHPLRVNVRGELYSDATIGPKAQNMGLQTRRPAMLQKRRRKKVLKALAVVLGLFPPTWPAFVVGWLVWRSKPSQKSMRNVHAALKALKKEQAGIALKNLQDAHYLDPSNNDALYWLGLLLGQQHRWEESAEALSLVAERIPNLPEIEAALVTAYVAMKRPKDAIYHAQRLLDQAPYEPETPLILARAYEAAGEIDLAIQALERAPIHKPTLGETLQEIHYRLGELNEHKGCLDKAVHHFQRVYSANVTYKDVQKRIEALES